MQKLNVTKIIFNFIKILWIGSYSFVILFQIYSSRTGNTEHLAQATGYMILILALPISLIIFPLFGSLAILSLKLSLPEFVSDGFNILIEISCFILGYWQWFILPKWIYQWMQNRHMSKSR